MVVRNSHRRPVRSGVTLIDLTVTILIIGILASVTAPRFSGAMSYFRAESAANRLAADLRMARRFAIDKSFPQSIRVSSQKNAYVISTMEDPDRPGERYGLQLSSYPYHSQIVKMSFSDSDVITFDIHGQCNFSGKILIVSGASQKIVEFSSENGEVTVQ